MSSNARDANEVLAYDKCQQPVQGFDVGCWRRDSIELWTWDVSKYGTDISRVSINNGEGITPAPIVFGKRHRKTTMVSHDTGNGLQRA